VTKVLYVEMKKERVTVCKPIMAMIATASSPSYIDNVLTLGEAARVK
jgi:hypothetical protein